MLLAELRGVLRSVLLPLSICQLVLLAVSEVSRSNHAFKFYNYILNIFWLNSERPMDGQ